MQDQKNQNQQRPQGQDMNQKRPASDQDRVREKTPMGGGQSGGAGGVKQSQTPQDQPKSK